MPIDPFRDYTLEETRSLDLRDLFAEGIRDAEGRLLPVLQGIGSVAAAVQALDQKVPLYMVGLMLTNANEKTLLGAQRHPEDLLEELEKRGFTQFAGLVRAGIASCQNEDDYLMLVRWLGMVRNLMVLRSQAPTQPTES
ncbi:MAG TPA: hypothetical protein VIO61_03875 [Anaerolineaceae bacterium]